MENTNSLIKQSKIKKVVLYNLVIIILVCLATALVACGQRQPRLSTPTELKFDKEAYELTWNQVENSTGGYVVEISGNGYDAREYSVKGRVVKVFILDENGEYVKDEDGGVVGRLDDTLGEITNFRRYSRSLHADLQRYKETDIEAQLPHPNWFVIPTLNTGTYFARLKAVTIDTLYYKDSDWSSKVSVEVEREAGITYRLINDGSEYEVLKIGTASGDVEIFSHYENKPITSIADLAFSGVGANRLTSIIIGPNIKSIGASAFFNATRLSSITLPDGLLTVGSNAFQNCLSLESIEFPDSVISIGSRAFQGCSLLESVKLSDSLMYLSDNLFLNCRSLKEVTFGSKLIGISTYAFAGTTNLSSLTLPDSVMIIEPLAFANCDIRSIVIPLSMKRIEQQAFYQAYSLSNVVIHAGVTSIGAWAFTETAIWNNSPSDIVYVDKWYVGCKEEGIATATIVEGTVGICDSGFRKFSNLVSISIPDSLMYIGVAAFEDTAIWKNTPQGSIVYADKWAVGYQFIPWTESKKPPVYPINNLVFKDDTQGIGYEAFRNRAIYIIPEGEPYEGQIVYSNEFTEVNFPSKLKTIGDYAFRNNRVLYNITLPDSLKRIGDYAFYECSMIGLDPQTEEFIYPGLENVTLPNGITSIGAYAFGLNRAFTDITIPASITSISDGLFYGCIQMTNITLHNNITSIGAEAFAHMYALTDISIPDSVTSIGQRAFYSSYGLESITVPHKVTSIADETFAYTQASGIKINLHDGITSIGNSAFFGSSITDIELPDGLTYLGESAFESARFLTSIVIPNGITHLNKKTFKDCQSLASVTLPDGLKTIDDYTFTDCYRLLGISIPQGVTRIGRYVFYNCTELTDVTLPKTLTSIGDYAFLFSNKLSVISIPSSVIGMGNHVFWNCFSLTIYIEQPWRPENWSVHWNSAKRPVIWGAVLSEDKSYVVSVKTLENSIMYTNPSVPEDYLYNSAVGLESISKPYRRDNFGFAGWSMSKDSENIDYTHLSIINAPQNTVLYAVWKQLENIEYTFDANGGYLWTGDKDYASTVSVKDYILLRPQLPVMSVGEEEKEWVFAGWFDNPELSGVPVGFPYYCTEKTKTTLYAKWLPIRTYMFIGNGGSIPIDDETVTGIVVYEGAVLIKDVPEFNREGWIFAGWYDNEELEGEPISFPYCSMDGTKTTLYAKWIESEE